MNQYQTILSDHVTPLEMCKNLSNSVLSTNAHCCTFAYSIPLAMPMLEIMRVLLHFGTEYLKPHRVVLC
jgi:hypothetical protein